MLSPNLSARSGISNVPVGSFLKNPAIRTNLLVMTLCWSSGSFNSFLISFMLKYFPGDIYVNTLASASSDIAAAALSGILYNIVGPRRALGIFFGLACLAGCLIVWYEHSIHFFDGPPENSGALLFPFLVLSAAFGTTAAVNTIYIGNCELFPVLFAATANGICNFSARIGNILCPQLAEVQGLTPMIVFSLLSGAASLSTRFLYEYYD